MKKRGLKINSKEKGEMCTLSSCLKRACPYGVSDLILSGNNLKQNFETWILPESY